MAIMYWRPALLLVLGVLPAAFSRKESPSPASSSSHGSQKVPPPVQREWRPLAGVRRVVEPPLRIFAEAPPITRSWVTLSVLMAALVHTRVLDLRTVSFSERSVLYKGEWWRLLLNFIYMGDSIKSLFFWSQLQQFWESIKVLELVKYRWEPMEFVKTIVGNAGLLLIFKQFFPAMMFLGSPLVMALVYMYAREYEQQVMNLLGLFQIPCGWLPFAQVLQDLVQVGDIRPNILGLISGHTYYYLKEARPRMHLPQRWKLGEVVRLLLRGKLPSSLAEDSEAENAAKSDDKTVSSEDADAAEAEGDAVEGSPGS